MLKIPDEKKRNNNSNGDNNYSIPKVTENELKNLDLTMLKEILEEILQTVQRIESRQISTTSPYLSVSEAADYLKISESSMRRLLRSGKIPYQRININESNTRNSSKILITRKHLDQFVFYGEQKDVSKKDIEKVKQWIW